LSYEENPEFLPVKFLYVIDVIECFGDLVFQRLSQLRQAGDKEVDHLGRRYYEVGNNWVLKTKSIRELLPRIFIEASLLNVSFSGI
jgi:hypothetical protein